MQTTGRCTDRRNEIIERITVETAIETGRERRVRNKYASVGARLRSVASGANLIFSLLDWADKDIQIRLPTYHHLYFTGNLIFYR